jgi:hypothetical protein
MPMVHQGHVEPVVMGLLARLADPAPATDGHPINSPEEVAAYERCMPPHEADPAPSAEGEGR